MAQYPNLTDCAVPDYPCPNYDDIADLSSDEDDGGCFVLEGLMYDDHGQLVPVTEGGPDTPAANTTVPATPTASTPSVPVNVEAAKLPTPSSLQTSSGKREITVRKDANGKLGIKLTRMGPRMFFSYVEKNSSAAKCGLGFGDQIIQIHGLDIARMSGSKLMQVMSSPTLKEFKMFVSMRPFDFELKGKVDAHHNMQCFTQQAKFICSVKIERIARTGYIRNLKLLGVNNESVFCCRETEILALLLGCVGKQVTLRVMPSSLYAYLMRKQSRDKVKDLMQLSPRIL